MRSKIVKHTNNYEHIPPTHICLVTFVPPMFSDRDRILMTPETENIIFVLMSSISVKHDFAFLLYR